MPKNDAFEFQFPANTDEFKAIVDGRGSCAICVGHRDIAKGDVIIHEVAMGKDTGRYLHINVDKVRYALLEEVTAEELANNGITQENAHIIIDEYLNARSVAGEYTEAERILLGAPNVAAHIGEIALLVNLRSYDADIGWRSKVTVVSFSNPQLVSKEEAETILAARSKPKKLLDSARKIPVHG